MAPKNIIGFITTVSNQKILQAYSQYLENPNVKIEDKVAYNWLEESTAKLFGGVARGGSGKLLPDIVIEDTALINLFRDKLGIDKDDVVEIETKFRRTSIAPSYIDVQGTTKDIAFQLTETTTGIGSSLLSDAVRKTFKKGELITNVKALNASGGIGWFSLIKRKDPELYKLFYNKAKFLQISYKLGASVVALNLYTPPNRFTNPPFEMAYANNALKLYLNNAFEKKLLLALQDVKPIQVSSIEQLRKDFVDISFGKKVKIKTRDSKQLTISIPTGGSIPITSATLNPASAEETLNRKGTTKQRFISAVQWTTLIQKRLGDTMLRFGAPEPPNLKWRTGDNFVDSVKINVNYKTNMIMYWYNPFLDSLRQYGYRPDLQVAKATREVAQQLYSRKFNIVRSPGI
jgi:hypothetical protein